MNYLAQIIKNKALQEPLQSKTGLEFFQKLLPGLVGMGFVIGAIVFFFVMIIGAIQWIFSGGDKASIESARGKIMNAVVGIIILLSAFALVKILEAFFGTNIITLDLGPIKIE